MSWGMAALIVLAAGLGLRHAVAPDHLAAVSTFVKAMRSGARKSVGYALSIGGGHSLGMLFVGFLLFVVLHHIPESVVSLVSRISGLWLMLLSLWILLDLLRPTWRFGSQRLESWREAHASLGQRRAGLAAWGVGLLFGLAVSPADLAIFTMALAQSSQPVLGLILLLIFLAAMMAGLAGVGLVIGIRGDGIRARVSVGLSGLSGFFGLGIGFMLVFGLLH